MNDLFKKALYALFPRRCELCGNVVALDEKRCDDCISMHKITGEICEYCGCEKEHCNCKKHKKNYSGVVAPYYYEDNVCLGMHRLKFSNFPELAVGMGEEIANTVKLRYKDIGFDYITYVPITEKRYKFRGYNQAQLLSNSISKQINVPVINTLYKTRDNQSQRTLSVKERGGNVFGVYEVVDGFDPTDKTFLLIDDVKTTGSTLDECAKMLILDDAKAVYVATFAITRHDKKKKYVKDSIFGFLKEYEFFDKLNDKAIYKREIKEKNKTRDIKQIKKDSKDKK